MLIKVNRADMKFYKYLSGSVQIPTSVSAEVLVAFANNDQHLNVDHYESDKLPNKTSSEKFYESCRNHCGKVLIIRFYCIFNLLHIFSF